MGSCRALRRRILLAILAACACHGALAQRVLPPPAPPFTNGADVFPGTEGAYFRDLARVVAQIRVVDWTLEVCAEGPDDEWQANLAAVQAWKAGHRAVIEEMETAFQRLPAYWAGSARASAPAGPAAWAKINALVNEKHDFLVRSSTSELGSKSFKLICTKFPRALQGPAFDIEKRFAAELVSIRRGPG